MKMKTTLAVLLIMELYGLSSGLIKQHFFVSHKKSWIDAQKHCKTFYHDLSSFINENEEQQFLEEVDDPTDDAWVGLFKVLGVWKWSGGEDATRISWDTDENQPENGNCAFLHKGHKKIHDKACTDKYNFYCMNKSEFVLVQQNESWEGALEYCRKHYISLASLSSKYSMKSALAKITQAQTDYVWTGLRFLAGKWLWISGDDVDHTVWSMNGQPECPARNLRCGALNKQTQQWTPRDCEEKLNFFCSVEAEDDTELDCC